MGTGHRNSRHRRIPSLHLPAKGGGHKHRSGKVDQTNRTVINIRAHVNLAKRGRGIWRITGKNIYVSFPTLIFTTTYSNTNKITNTLITNGLT